LSLAGWIVGIGISLILEPFSLARSGRRHELARTVEKAASLLLRQNENGSSVAASGTPGWKGWYHGLECQS